MFDRVDEGRWWDFGWQLVEGCTKVSPGCDHCWSLAKEKRFRKETGVVFYYERLERLKRKKPAAFSIWNDLFHPAVEVGQTCHVFDTIEQNQQHIVMALTKRPELAFKHLYGQWQQPGGGTWQYTTTDSIISNLWLGVTVESPNYWKRAKVLQDIPAAVKFLSLEPLLGGLGDLDLRGINWVIVGAESGPGARHCKIEWVRDIVNQCKAAGVPVFVKQLHAWGTKVGIYYVKEEAEFMDKKTKQILLKDINLFPKDLRIREYPKGGE